MNETAMETLGKARTRKQPWITQDILDACDKRRKLRATRYNDIQQENEYRIANIEVRKKIARAKEEFLEQKCGEIQEGFEGNNSKLAFNTIKQLHRKKSARQTAIEDESGKLLTERGQIQDRWTQYVKELYNYPIQTVPQIVKELEDGGPGITEEAEPDITRREVQNAILKLKKGKAAGADNVPAELLQTGEATVTVLHKICALIWKRKEWPIQWTQSLIIPILKKGNLRKCDNYRTISLICHASKVMLRIIGERLKPQIEIVLAEE